jgi:hypothetical protein
VDTAGGSGRVVAELCVTPLRQLLRCQYLYFCTSKASKARTSGDMVTRSPGLNWCSAGLQVHCCLVYLRVLGWNQRDMLRMRCVGGKGRGVCGGGGHRQSERESG